MYHFLDPLPIELENGSYLYATAYQNGRFEITGSSLISWYDIKESSFVNRVYMQVGVKAKNPQYYIEWMKSFENQ